jgi:hypothetical protein
MQLPKLSMTEMFKKVKQGSQNRQQKSQRIEDDGPPITTELTERIQSPANIRRDQITLYEDTLHNLPEHFNFNNQQFVQGSPIYTDSSISPARVHGLANLPSSGPHPPQYRNHGQSDLDGKSEYNNSFILIYALHYEVKLMRKIWKALSHYRLQSMRTQLHHQLAEYHYAKKLRDRAFVALRRHSADHYGHKFAKA